MDKRESAWCNDSRWKKDMVRALLKRTAMSRVMSCLRQGAVFVICGKSSGGDTALQKSLI